MQQPQAQRCSEMRGKVYSLFKSQGIARTQSPPNKNCAPESYTFGMIARVNPTVVQWRGLALGEPPWRSRYLLCQVSMLSFRCSKALYIFHYHQSGVRVHQITYYTLLHVMHSTIFQYRWLFNFIYRFAELRSHKCCDFTTLRWWIC